MAELAYSKTLVSALKPSLDPNANTQSIDAHPRKSGLTALTDVLEVEMLWVVHWVAHKESSLTRHPQPLTLVTLLLERLRQRKFRNVFMAKEFKLFNEIHSLKMKRKMTKRVKIS